MKPSRAEVKRLKALERISTSLEILVEAFRLQFGGEVMDEAMANLGLFDVDSGAPKESEDVDD